MVMKIYNFREIEEILDRKQKEVNLDREFRVLALKMMVKNFLVWLGLKRKERDDGK